jgi:trimeric autotransporter adhesin
VQALCLFQGRVIAGGGFNAIGDARSAKFVAAYDGTTWSPLPYGSNNNGVGSAVNALAEYAGKLYVGGAFTTFGDWTTSAKYIAAYDGSTWSTLPSGASNGVSGAVNALAEYGGKLYVGGRFTQLGNGATTAKYIAAWDGSSWSTLPGLEGVDSTTAVNALAVYAGKLYVGGVFYALTGGGPNSARFIIAWDGAAWVKLLVGTSNGLGAQVRALTVFNNKLYVGGDFTTIGSGAATGKYLVGWDGSAWSTVPTTGANNGLTASVLALTTDGSNLYVGGTFKALDGGAAGTAKYVAAWDGSTWSTLASGTSNGVDGAGGAAVHALLPVNNSLFLGGTFSVLGDQRTPAHYIARASSGTIAPVYARSSSVVSGLAGGIVNAIVSDFRGSVILGGAFVGTADGNRTFNHVVAYNGTWSALPVGTSNGVAGAVNALCVWNNRLYVGGAFAALGDGTSARYVAAWDGSTWSTLGTGASNGVDYHVNALAVYAGKLYVGGAFGNAGTLSPSANMIAAWSGTAWSPLTNGGLNGLASGAIVYALCVYSGKLYIAGAFNYVYSGTMVNNVVAWDGTSFSALVHTNGDRGVGFVTWALGVYAGKLFVGGKFLRLGLGPVVANQIVAWDGTAWSFLPAPGATNGMNGEVYAFTVWNDKLIIGGDFTGLYNGVPAPRLAQWDNATQTLTRLGTAQTVQGGVRALAPWGSTLLVGGGFRHLSDGTMVNFVASFTGTF